MGPPPKLKLDYLGGSNRTLDENDDDDDEAEAEYKTRTNVYGESIENKQMRMRPTYYGNCYLFVSLFFF